MARYILAGIIAGVLFGVMDGLINANRLAQDLYAVFKPISRVSVNVAIGVIIDLFYGFIMAAIFLVLYASLPGDVWIIKGLSYGLIIWFFRVFMSAASQWMTFDMPVKTIGYSLGTGLIEMLVIGIVYGWLLKPLR